MLWSLIVASPLTIAPVLSFVNVIAVILKPFVPSAPGSPLSPLSPFSPFKFLNSKLNTFAVSSPLAITVTEGVPILASTVAVGVPNPADTPGVPGAPSCPSVPLVPSAPFSPVAPLILPFLFQTPFSLL